MAEDEGSGLGQTSLTWRDDDGIIAVEVDMVESEPGTWTAWTPQFMAFITYDPAQHRPYMWKCARTPPSCKHRRPSPQDVKSLLRSLSVFRFIRTVVEGGRTYTLDDAVSNIQVILSYLKYQRQRQNRKPGPPLDGLR